jgi:hypothetical protein
MPIGGARPGAGRKKGAPNKATADVKALAGKYADAAMKELGRLATKAESEQARVAAIKELLDRAFGKSKQAVEFEGALTGALTVTYVTNSKAPAAEPSAEDYET